MYKISEPMIIYSNFNDAKPSELFTTKKIIAYTASLLGYGEDNTDRKSTRQCYQLSMCRS